MQPATWVGPIVAAMAAAVAIGCVTEEPTATQTVKSKVEGPCTNCGDNSPIVGRLGIHELSLRGEPNHEGYSMVLANNTAQIIQGANSYSLRLMAGHLKGASLTLGKIMHEGVVGAVIPIQRNGVQYELIIRAVHIRKFAVEPGWGMESYTLGWREVGGAEVNPCADPGSPSTAPIDDKTGMYREEAIVFEGDRIDPVGKTMSTVADDAWFNIACAGDALAKLRVTRNTIHSQPQGLANAWEQRQAALKMMVADYCGTGQAFTVPGQKVVWKSPGIAYVRLPDVLEARWTQNGASCVHAPRMLFPTTPDGAAAFPDIWQSITSVCQPVDCADLDPLSYDGAHVVSAKPVDE